MLIACPHATTHPGEGARATILRHGAIGNGMWNVDVMNDIVLEHPVRVMWPEREVCFMCSVSNERAQMITSMITSTKMN